MNKAFYITIFIFTLVIPLTFWCGVRAGRKNLIQCQSELLQVRQELKIRLGVEVARRAQIEWLKQREDAFQESVRLFQEK